MMAIAGEQARAVLPPDPSLETRAHDQGPGAVAFSCYECKNVMLSLQRSVHDDPRAL